ncbi:hypothetical protein ES703_51742 [subsurface metagenome]
MGVQEMALMLLGIGIISEQFGGGLGLQQLGAGVQSLVAAPLIGTGTGLSSLAQGLVSIATAFGDIGQGIAALLDSLGGLPGIIPGLPPGLPTGNGNGNGIPLIPMSGGDDSTDLTGGGGNVPTPPLQPPISPVPTPSPYWPTPVQPPYLLLNSTGGSNLVML